MQFATFPAIPAYIVHIRTMKAWYVHVHVTRTNPNMNLIDTVVAACFDSPVSIIHGQRPDYQRKSHQSHTTSVPYLLSQKQVRPRKQIEVNEKQIPQLQSNPNSWIAIMNNNGPFISGQGGKLQGENTNET